MRIAGPTSLTRLMESSFCAAGGAVAVHTGAGATADSDSAGGGPASVATAEPVAALPSPALSALLVAGPGPASVV